MRGALAALALASVALAAAVSQAGVPASEAYVLHCSGCHGPSGAGHPDFVPDLREIGALLDRPGGRAYLARVPGVAQAPVADAELADLLNWVLTEISRVPDLHPYGADEIGAFRREPLRDPVAARP